MFPSVLQDASTAFWALLCLQLTALIKRDYEYRWVTHLAVRNALGTESRSQSGARVPYQEATSKEHEFADAPVVRRPRGGGGTSALMPPTSHLQSSDATTTPPDARPKRPERQAPPDARRLARVAASVAARRRRRGRRARARQRRRGAGGLRGGSLDRHPCGGSVQRPARAVGAGRAGREVPGEARRQPADRRRPHVRLGRGLRRRRHDRGLGFAAATTWRGRSSRSRASRDRAGFPTRMAAFPAGSGRGARLACGRLRACWMHLYHNHFSAVERRCRPPRTRRTRPPRPTIALRYEAVDRAELAPIEDSPLQSRLAPRRTVDADALAGDRIETSWWTGLLCLGWRTSPSHARARPPADSPWHAREAARGAKSRATTTVVSGP